MSHFDQMLKNAIWVGKVLFERNKATGSSANLSFLREDKIYITGSGTCFGNLTETNFSIVDLEGNHISGIKPSKELPLHITLYEKDPSIQAVLHTHSFYSTLWSCLQHENVRDVIPSYTPYLRMKLGTVGLVPYAKPGSDHLFKLFKERVNDSDGYLLENHGPIIGDKNLISAFYILEELEESARIAWELRNEKAKLIP